MSQTVLIVEDEPDIRKLEVFVMEGEGYRVLTADNGDDAIRIALEENPDLILLDIIIPGPDGLEVCRRLREEKLFSPILFVTARKEQWEQVAGLTIGADHYIVKPFSPAYLASLVRAALRRESAYREEVESPTVLIADVELDFSAKRAMRDGEEIHLTPGEWIVLESLAANPDRVLSREQLQERLWDAVTDEGISSRTVDMHISRLRQKLGEAAGEQIVTARNFGYRLNRT
ncbi:MAG: response regulator transcription factor [Armatimonadetes bacterium]|nr:response regulator transcription factor [Armatimonadota bacterium]